MIHQDELTFDFGNYCLVYSFVKKYDALDSEEEDEDYENEFYSYNNISDLKDIDELMQNVQFSSYQLRGLEFMGWRADSEYVRSISNELHYFVRQMNLYNSDIIIDYNLDLDYGEDYGYCDVPPNYCFNIFFNKEFFSDIQLAEFILEKIDTLDIKGADFYLQFLTEEVKIKDNKQLNILTTNTKVRRLGYFKALSEFIDHKKVPVVSINKKFESYCQVYSDEINSVDNNKGLVIETKSGISAKPYIDLAASLGYLTKVNNLYSSGKILKVFQVLKKQYFDEGNIFFLNDFDKLFFLENILKNDFFYFKNLLEMISIKDETSYSEIISSFQSKLIDNLDEFIINTGFDSNRKITTQLKNIQKRIANWEKPNIYLEHVIMPRLNWMNDLGLIKLNAKNTIKLTPIGNRLFSHLCMWDDINTEKTISPNEFLDRFAVHLFDDCYNDEKTINPDDLDFILKRIYFHIRDSFNFFQTLAPNRVTASQAINYTKYKLYFEDKIKVEFKYIENKLSDKNQVDFIFKYQEQYQDGYIQLKKQKSHE